MAAAVVVLALALTAAVVFAVQRSMALAAATKRASELDERVASLEADLAAANNRADVADAKATKATGEAAAATKRADLSDRDAKEATTRAEAEHERAEAMTRRADLAEAALLALSAEGLWALETRRIGRVWRDRVSVTLDGISPVAGAPDPAEAATRVLADASREEAGVVVDVSWLVEPPLTVGERVLLVRVAEELIAAAWATDGADLDVTTVPADEPDGVGTIELRLTTEPATHASADLADAMHACGADVAVDGPAIVVRLPRSKARGSR